MAEFKATVLFTLEVPTILGVYEAIEDGYVLSQGIHPGAIKSGEIIEIKGIAAVPETETENEEDGPAVAVCVCDRPIYKMFGTAQAWLWYHASNDNLDLACGTQYATPKPGTVKQ